MPADLHLLPLRRAVARLTKAQLARRRTLVVLGDVFPLYLGVEAKESLPARLAEGLHSAGIGVVNSSQTCYNLAQWEARSRRLLPRLESDAVLLTMFLANDVMDGSLLDPLPPPVEAR